MNFMIASVIVVLLNAKNLSALITNPPITYLWVVERNDVLQINKVNDVKNESLQIKFEKEGENGYHYFKQTNNVDRVSKCRLKRLRRNKRGICKFVNGGMEGWSERRAGWDYGETRLRVVPHFSSGIVERAKREGAWKSPHARKAWGDFHARSRFASSTIPQEKWGLWGNWSNSIPPNDEIN